MAKRAAPKPPRNELLALLRAAKRQPDDDAPRLVLADWLQEHGDDEDRARAEYIRLDLRLARMQDHIVEDEAVKRRDFDLFAGHWRQWCCTPKANMPPFFSIPRGLLKVRGTLAEVLGRVSKFLAP